MTPISGKKILKNFNEFIKVSDLIYFDGPLLSHFVSPSGENYLFYWCDVDDNFNRWIILRVDLNIIQKYIQKELSLREIISNPSDGFVYVADIDDNIQYNTIYILLDTEIPFDYLPEEDSYYDFEIRKGISLAGLSQKYSCGILELHISGRDVKYGSIPLEKFAQLLPKIDEIRKGMASKFIKICKNTIEDKTALENLDLELKLDTEYEYLYSIAGSVRVILKPISVTHDLDNSRIGTYADSFAEDFTGLLASGYSKEEIVKFSQKYDKQLIKKYDDFVRFLSEKELSIDVNWCNVGTSISYSTNINQSQTHQILANLSDFDYDTKETLEMVGKFYSLNIRSGNYSFESTEGDGEKTLGHLDDFLKEAAECISFNRLYHIKVERKAMERIGQKKKIIDTIVEFSELSK